MTDWEKIRTGFVKDGLSTAEYDELCGMLEAE